MSSLDLALQDFQLELDPSNGHVRWCSSNPKHPRNWPLARKAWDIGLITILELYTTALSTSGAYAAKYGQETLGLGVTTSQFLFVSTYLLGQGVGGLVFPPWAECFGRKKLYVVSTILYSGFCAIIGGVDHPAAAVSSLLIAGFLSAIPTCSITGSIEDMFNAKDRIWMMLAFIGTSNNGMALGPVMSAYITHAFNWKWIYYISAMITAGMSLLLLTIKESRPSLILAREVEALRKVTGEHSLEAANPDNVPDWQTFVAVDLCRPLRLLFTEPIVFAVSIMGGTAMAILYLLTEALPRIYEAKGFNPQEASLPFLALGIGFIFNIPGRILEHRAANALRKTACSLDPEYRLGGLTFAAPALAGALWWFAWTIPPLVQGVHWVVPVLALLAIGYGRNELSIVLTGYMADSYSSYAGSAIAAWSLTRAVLSAIFPLFAPVMFSALGANIAVSVLAATMTVFIIIPIMFQRYGKTIRERSKFAAYSMQVYQKHTVEKHGY